MAMDALDYKKMVAAGKAGSLRIGDDLAVVVLQRFDPNTGERLSDAMEQIEISQLIKARDHLASKVAAMTEMIDSISAQEIAIAK